MEHTAMVVEISRYAVDPVCISLEKDWEGGHEDCGKFGIVASG